MVFTCMQVSLGTFYSQRAAISSYTQESTGKQTRAHRQRLESKPHKIHQGDSTDDSPRRTTEVRSEGKHKIDIVSASLQFSHTEGD